MKEAMLYQRLSGGKVRCDLCAHRCVIFPGQAGICRVRQNRDGNLYSLVYGHTAGQNDGVSRWRIPRITDHAEAGAWLVKELLSAEVVMSDGELRIRGVGFSPRR